MLEFTKVEKWIGQGDFALWKRKIKAALIMEGLWDAVLEVWPAEPALTEAQKKVQKDKVHSTIFVKLSDEVMLKISDLPDDNPKLLWETLDKLYYTITLPSKLTLLSRLVNFKMDTSFTLQENLDAFLRINQELKRIRKSIDEELQAVILLNSLPSQYNTFRDVIEYCRDDLNVDKITETICRKEETIKAFKSKSSSKTDPKNELNFVKGKNKKKGKKQGNKGSKDKGEKTGDKNPSDGNNNNGNKPAKHCTYCNRNNHTIEYCFKKKRKEGTLDSKNPAPKTNDSHVSSYTNVCETKGHYQAELLCVYSEICCLSPRLDSSSWILDSGCTIHASPYKNLFSSLTMSDEGEVKLGDHTSLQIKGTGNISLKLHDGVTRVLQNVKYVPNLRMNLLSESALDNLGCQIVTSKGVKEVIRNGKVILKAENIGDLYYIKTYTEINVVVSSDKTAELTKIWHARLGHIGNTSLLNLYKSGIIPIKPIDLDFCETCILGKKTAHSFQKSEFNVSNPLEYVHSDLWGPSQVSTVGGKNYFLSIVDHYSRKVWIYLLKAKSEAFEFFSKWKVYVESQTSYKLKCLRTDNGLEFCNKDFDDFCSKFGIKRHHTVPYTPQQNGIAERMNRTLLDRARCLLFSSGIKSSLWG